MADLVQRILDLRKRVDQAADLRSKATTALEVAKQRLADVDARLKEHGINPEQCEPELKALEQSLDQHVTEFDAKLTDEIAAYNRIIAAAQAADAGERVMIGDADVARVVHEAIRAFCLVTEARELPSWDKASDSDRDSTVQAVQFTREHPEADPESEHERWCNEKIAAGWRYDAVRDNAKKHHPALMPYAQLSVIQRQKDALIQAIVRALGGVMPALAIIVPTIGRNTLTRTLGSLRGQITANDVVMVVLDAHTMTPEHCDDVERLVSSAAALFPSPPRVMRHDAGHGCWGHPQRNAAMLAAPSEMWLVFNDDDDVFTPGALDAVRSAIDAQESPRPLLFQFITPWRSVLWSQPQRVVLGEIGTPCLVLRRDMVGDARWGDRYEGDFDMISAVVEAHGGPTGVDWVPHVIVKTRPEPT